MKKYMILVLLIAGFQEASYSADLDKKLNQAIMPELKSAQMLLKMSIKPELKMVVPALVAYGKMSNINKILAVGHMQSIKAALQKYKSKQYSIWYTISWAFGSNPEIVTQQINPALEMVTNGLEDLNVVSYDSGYQIVPIIAIAFTAASVITAGLILHVYNKPDVTTKSSPASTLPNSIPEEVKARIETNPIPEEVKARIELNPKQNPVSAEVEDCIEINPKQTSDPSSSVVLGKQKRVKRAFFPITQSRNDSLSWVHQV